MPNLDPMEGRVFCVDPQLDRALRLRALTVISSIRQIQQEVRPEFFVKYLERYLNEEEARCRLPEVANAETEG